MANSAEGMSNSQPAVGSQQTVPLLVNVAPWQPSFNPWMVGVVVALAAFMEILDTSIANVALPYIAGGLGASNDQATWVLTSYLAANAIVLPMGAWFSNLLGRKRFFMVCLVVFTFSSVLCGTASSLGAIILFRALQGAGGGGLQPMAQAILADTFPPAKRGLAFALYGITAVFAPTIGPTLGGWITDNYSWRWIFFINVPVGIVALALVFRLVEDPPWAKRGAGGAVKMDYVAFAFLAVGVGALQVMLDKGQEDDWFGSHFILRLAIVAAVCLVSLVIWEWFRKNPLIDVKLFKNLNFTGSFVMIFMLGIMLFASLVMIPLFLQTLLGYTAELAGLVLSGGGVLLLFLMPFAGALVNRIQARYLIAFGWLTLSLAMYYTTQNLDLQISFGVASILRVVQVFGLGFLFVPINLISFVGMPPEKSNAIAGLINFGRNIGSSIGTSMVTTLIARRSQFHQLYLVKNISPADPAFNRALQGLAARLHVLGLSRSVATSQAYARLYQALIGQATTLAYIDTFWVLCIGAGVMFLVSFALRRNQPGGGGEVAVG
jgi:MFS transporter, DHA2 family, multidrug resistance protein